MVPKTSPWYQGLVLGTKDKSLVPREMEIGIFVGPNWGFSKNAGGDGVERGCSDDPDFGLSRKSNAGNGKIDNLLMISNKISPPHALPRTAVHTQDKTKIGP